MGRAVELLSGFVTAPSTTQTALTMATGNSNVVRNFNQPARAFLLQAWNDNQTAGVLRALSPRMHDGVQGIRMQAGAANPRPLLPYVPTPLESQDTLTLDLSGSATAGDIESASFLVLYEDLPGVAGRFIDKPTLYARGRQMMAVQSTLALGTAGGYSGEVAINATFDNIKANKDYALLGYHVTVECCSVRWRGSDTGNLGVGGPGNLTNRDVTSQWFVLLAEKFGFPMIPVFNGSNKGSILIDGVQDENGADTVVSSILMELD